MNMEYIEVSAPSHKTTFGTDLQSDQDFSARVECENFEGLGPGRLLSIRLKNTNEKIRSYTPQKEIL